MSTMTAAVPSRLLAGASGRRVGLRAHLELHGRLEPDGADGSLIALVAAAGLRGRGGAAFPTATKMAAVAEAGRGAIVVANGAEGEPMSVKDRTLLEAYPHLVLDGAVLGARAVGAREAIVCVPRRCGGAQASIVEALRERQAARLDGVSIRLVTTPDRYLAGEESALVSFLNGGAVKPTFVPPRPFERGVRRRPTLVQNVETLAHLALIARHGSLWFRQAGTAQEPGTALVTLAGAVRAPGVYEIPLGLPLEELLHSAGGPAAAVRGVLIGGYFGSWVDGRALDDLVLHEDHLRPLGGGLGSGVIVVLPAGACPVAETARVTAYLSREAAGQCGPCTHGLGAVADAVAGLARGRATRTVETDLERWSALVPGRGACHHPDGAIRFASSALRVFAAEFADHRRQGPCDACAAPGVLAIPGAPREAWR